MVNICESVKKTVNRNKRKWLIRLNQNRCESGLGETYYPHTVEVLSGLIQAPNPACTHIAELGNPVQSSRMRNVVVRQRGCAGLRGWKKRRLAGNRQDTDTGYPTRKCAHVQLVFFCKRVWRIDLMGTSK